MTIHLSLVEYLLTYDMIRHQMPFNNFYTFVTAQLLYYLPDILFILIINYFSSILWSEDDMVLTHPLCVC